MLAASNSHTRKESMEAHDISRTEAEARRYDVAAFISDTRDAAAHQRGSSSELLESHIVLKSTVVTRLFFFHSQIQKVHSPNLPKEKCMSEVVRIDSMIISWEWKG